MGTSHWDCRGPQRQAENMGWGIHSVAARQLSFPKTLWSDTNGTKRYKSRNANRTGEKRGQQKMRDVGKLLEKEQLME